MQTYSVRRGDTLGTIAARHKTSVETLARLNGLRDPDKLAVGQKLRFPDTFAPSSRIDAPTRPLKLGAKGPAVEQLQKALVKVGNLSAAEMKTGPGVFGPRTMAAVKEFQSSHGLPTTGIYGPKTQAALAKALDTNSMEDLKRGSKGAQVKELQQALVKLGHLDSADYQTGPGTFGALTEAAVERFQAAHGLEATGVCGPRTRAALAKALAEDTGGGGTGGTGELTGAGLPDTSGLSTAKRFALYEKYIGKFGDAQAKKDLAAGKRVILSLRQDTPMTANQPRLGTYDDRIVVMWKDRSGSHVEELRANTEPNRRWAIPANQSSKPVGRLADNQTVRYHKAWNSRFGNHLQPSGNPFAQRDTDRDYRFENNEKAYNGALGGQAMFIHRAWAGNTGSQGCQTMDASRFNTFWSSLGGQKDFSYVLVNVTKH